MKISEYERGHRDATKEAITWLHAEALRMNDPHAQGILNGAAFSLGVATNTDAAKAKVAARGRQGARIKVKVAELMEVLETLKVGKGLRRGLVGGLEPTADIRPAEGGMVIEVRGTGTIMALESGQLSRAWTVDQANLVGLVSALKKLGTPDLLVTIVELPNYLEFHAGALTVSLVGQ